MADETMPDWEARHEQAARAAAARWAVEMVTAHPELLDLIPPRRRFLYIDGPDYHEHDDE